MRRAVLATSLVLAVACGGGDSGSTPNPPATPTSPTMETPTAPTTVAGEPSSADWTELAGQIAGMSQDSLVAALASSGGSSTFPAVTLPLTLQQPSADVSLSAAYFCCGTIGTSSYLTMDSAIRLVQGAGIMSLVQNVTTSNTTDWVGSDGTSWRIIASGLRVSSDIVTDGGVVRAGQEFRVTGAFLYTLPNGDVKRAEIDLVLRYQNVESGSPTASGAMGPTQLSPDQTLAPTTSPARCSRPLEGCTCIPGCSGTAPCTLWPQCPA